MVITELRRLAALQVPLYTAEIVEKYVNRGTPRDGSEPPEPHVFLTADSAYKAMARNNVSQSLVITGESGSGKTETTKIAMQVQTSINFVSQKGPCMRPTSCFRNALQS